MINDQDGFVCPFIVPRSSFNVSPAVEFPAELFFVSDGLRAEFAPACAPEIDDGGDEFGAAQYARVASFGDAQAEVITGVGIAALGRAAKLRDGRRAIRRPQPDAALVLLGRRTGRGFRGRRGGGGGGGRRRSG